MIIKYAVKVTNEKRTWYCKDGGKISTVTEKTNKIPTDWGTLPRIITLPEAIKLRKAMFG